MMPLFWCKALFAASMILKEICRPIHTKRLANFPQDFLRVFHQILVSNRKEALGSAPSFQNGDGELPGVVQSLTEEEVMVDFNHPLAGKSIVFTVKIIDVQLQSAH